MSSTASDCPSLNPGPIANYHGDLGQVSNLCSSVWLPGHRNSKQ